MRVAELPSRSALLQHRHCFSTPPKLPQHHPRTCQGRLVRVLANAEPAQAQKSKQLLVYAPNHPLLRHWLAVARSKMSPPPIFRAACAELGRLLVYEAAYDWLPVLESQVETPCGVADATVVDGSRPVKVIPILRAGLIMLEQAATMLPASQTFHVGYERNEETLQASLYLNKLPAKFAEDDRILISDPMLATGGTMLQLLADLTARGASPAYIKIVCIVCAPPALQVLNRDFPGVRVYTAMIDSELNEKGYIVPGLGDAGDRAFGTEKLE